MVPISSHRRLRYEVSTGLRLLPVLRRTGADELQETAQHVQVHQPEVPPGILH